MSQVLSGESDATAAKKRGPGDFIDPPGLP